MARVLLAGIDPDQVDFADPALPPGLDADKIRAGVDAVLEQLKAAGHQPVHLYIDADPAHLQPFADHIAAEPVDCVVIGGGVTRPPANMRLLEAMLNIIAQATPTPKIALVSTPQEATQAVQRALAL